MRPAVNHLNYERSPYLLQHVHNPVDWYPWGKVAFDKAKKENKPVLLSIGYSTCHWCHVMAHESFENEEIAKRINQYFVAVKVDREERPDIDQVYMSAVMAMTGHGGWPLTVFLTPDQKPFWGGTYFPPYAKWGSPGFLEIIESLHQSWQNNRQNIVESGQKLTEVLNGHLEKKAASFKLTSGIFDEAFAQYQSMYDPHFGGFGHQPKFPSSHNLSFLLRYGARAKNQQATDMVLTTLKKMRDGGMFDHVGGGFHRYSTDERWQIPHFEKMLYDQAILVKTYLEAYQITKESIYETTAREICDYVIRDMQNKDGGFFCAEDADSLDPYEQPSSDHKKEGAYYLWTKEDLDKILGDDADIFNFYYGVLETGNARLDPHQEFVGRNVVSAEHSLQEVAKTFKKTVKDIEDVLKRSRAKLFQQRLKRARPHLDDKILTDWNGLMISSLAQAASVTDDRKYLEAAQAAADFIIEKLMTKDGRLLHRYREGEAQILGHLDDYAFFINGLMDLYQANFHVRYLQRAHQLTDEMIRLFWDADKGGFFFTASDAEKLIFRQKEIYDGAMPSGNSMAALCLLRMYHLTLKVDYLERAGKMFEVFGEDVSWHPSAYAQMLSAFDYFLGPSVEIVLSGSFKDSSLKQMRKIIDTTFLPNKICVFNEIRNGEPDKQLSSLAPLIIEKVAINNQLTAYVCVNHACHLPVTNSTGLTEILENMGQSVFKKE